MSSNTQDENQPLLGTQNGKPADHGEDGVVQNKVAAIVDAVKPDVPEGSTVFSEVWVILKAAVPLIGAYLLQYSLSLVTVVVAGHLGSQELAATNVAVMTSSLTGTCIYEGLAAGLDTLCAQAYGAGETKQIGVHVQRMIQFMTFVTIPISILWGLAPFWMRILVPKPAMAADAGRVLAFLAIGNPGYFLFEAGRRFCQAQGLYNAPLYVMAISLPVDVFFNWLFVYKLHWGLTGMALALSVTRTLFPVFLLAYVLVVQRSSLNAWGGLEPFAPRSWKRMLQLAISGAAIVEAEVLFFEFLTLAATHLNTDEAAAQSVLTTVGIVLVHVPIAMGIGVATRIGHLIGSRRLKTARFTMKIAICLSVIVGCIDGALLYGLKDILLQAFTNSDDVIKYGKRAIPVLAIFMIAEHATGVVNGMLRGIAKQGRGAIVNFVLFAAVGVPLAIAFTFGSPKMGLSGLWLGALISYLCVATANGIYALRANLEKVAEEVESAT